MSGVRETHINLTQLILLLHNLPGVGEQTLTHILTHREANELAPKEILAYTPKQWQETLKVSAKTTQHFFQNQEALLKKSQEQERTRRLNDIHLFDIGSAAYPSYLEAYDSFPPPVVYARGNLSLLEPTVTKRFAILVSNNPTPAILQKLNEITEALCHAGGIVVTGHDRLPYKRAALAAQHVNRPILYVLDQGLRCALGKNFDKVLFAEASIQDDSFNTDVDVAVSHLPFDVPAMHNLQRRDRMVTSFANVLIALDVRPNGVMFSEAKRAFEQKRRLFVSTEGREGNRVLLDMGATALPTGSDWIQKVLG